MRFRRLISCGVLALLLIAAGGCGPGSTPVDTGLADAPQENQDQAVLAVVNGTKITALQMKKEAAGLSPYALGALGDKEARKMFLKKLIDKELLVQAATKMGLQRDPEVVKKLDEFRDNLVVAQYINKEIIDKAKVSEQEVRGYFDENKEDLGSVRLSHILTKSRAGAEEVIVKYKAGEPFKKLAKKYSIDPRSKNSGGDLGYFKWSEFGSADLKDTAYSLPLGEISPVVKSSLGFHVMKVTDKKPATDADFDGIKDALTQELARKKQEAMLEEVLAGLKDKANVKTNTETLDSLSFLTPTDWAAQGKPRRQEAPAAP